jgi:hypothetical protein
MIDYFISILIVLVSLVCTFAAVLLVLRLVVAIFSTKVSEEIRRHPAIHTTLGCLAVVGVLAWFGVISPDMWPRLSVKRGRQRAEVLKRINVVGGWAALQRDCDAFAEQHRDSAFVWSHGGDTNALPPTIAALRPWSVSFYSSAFLGDSRDEPQIPFVRIKVFGAHSTGGRSQPYFGLEVVCATNAESYRPEPSQGGAPGNRYNSYSRVSERIYEIYWANVGDRARTQQNLH